MDDRLYHFLVMLPIFAVVLLLIVMPPLQWLSTRLLDRKFVLRFGGAWNPADKNHRWDVLLSVAAFVISLAISLVADQMLIRKGILPPLR